MSDNAPPPAQPGSSSALPGCGIALAAFSRNTLRDELALVAHFDGET